MAPFTENLDEFLDTEEFASSVVQGAKTFLGVFTDEYEGTFEIEGKHPVLVVKDTALAATPATVQGVTLTVDGVSYKVQEIQPDGTGMSTLLLEKV